MWHYRGNDHKNEENRFPWLHRFWRSLVYIYLIRFFLSHDTLTCIRINKKWQHAGNAKFWLLWDMHTHKHLTHLTRTDPYADKHVRPHEMAVRLSCQIWPSPHWGRRLPAALRVPSRCLIRGIINISRQVLWSVRNSRARCLHKPTPFTTLNIIHTTYTRARTHAYTRTHAHTHTRTRIH